MLQDRWPEREREICRSYIEPSPPYINVQARAGNSINFPTYFRVSSPRSFRFNSKVVNAVTGNTSRARSESLYLSLLLTRNELRVRTEARAERKGLDRNDFSRSEGP